ncbi:MAG: hypothetical protein H7Y13_01170 [Sphingobacteriaceae bacterium]|nr:hypothetical protein [Sphingobacteriaceae bacterium]
MIPTDGCTKSFLSIVRHAQRAYRTAVVNLRFFYNFGHETSSTLLDATIYPWLQKRFTLRTSKRSNLDFENQNTKDGVVVEAYLPGISDKLVSYIPGHAIIDQLSLPKSIHDDSKFEIIKIEKLDDHIHLIEARFDINLYHKDGRLFRIKNGFVRVRTDMKVFP